MPLPERHDETEQWNEHEAHGFLFTWSEDRDSGIEEIMWTELLDDSLESCWVLLSRLCPVQRAEIRFNYPHAGEALVAAVERHEAGEVNPDPHDTCPSHSHFDIRRAAEGAAELVIEAEDFDL